MTCQRDSVSSTEPRIYSRQLFYVSLSASNKIRGSKTVRHLEPNDVGTTSKPLTALPFSHVYSLHLLVVHGFLLEHLLVRLLQIFRCLAYLIL